MTSGTGTCIGLLECDDVAGRFAGIAGGYPEMFAALLAPHIPNLRFHYYSAHEGELPGSPAECDAWLCSGSKYSAYEERGWIKRLSAFIRQAESARTPFVGICFGHQMIAHALGGGVARAPQGWGVGVLDVDVLRAEPWMQPPQTRLRLHHMHGDQIQRLPRDSVVLARGPSGDVEMFRAGDSMLGIEGHPEFTAPFAEALIRARRDDVGPERAERALSSLTRPTDGALLGRWISAFIARR